MKNRNNSHLFQIITLVLPLFILSCNLFNAQPLEQYLNEYTNSAAIVSHSFKSDYPVDKDGYTNIPSGDIDYINVLLRNPQQYRITCTPQLLSSQSQTIRNELIEEIKQGDPYTFTQDDMDRSLAKLNFSTVFLNRLEGGGDLSSVLTLTGYTSDGVPLRFENQVYTDFKVKVNTPPEVARNLVILQTKGEEPKYVVAFNMPDMTKIHKDIKKLIINDNIFNINPEIHETGINTSQYESFNLDSTYNANLNMSNGIPFNGASNSRCVFYNTNQLLQEEYVVTVILEDNTGLQSKISVSTNSPKLNPVTRTSEETEIETDDEGYGQLELKAPSKTTVDQTIKGLLTIHFIVYDKDNNFFKQGSGKPNSNGILKLSLPSGTWKIETWCTLSGYINSDTKEYNLKVKQKGIEIVLPEFNGYKITYNGITQDTDSMYKIIKTTNISDEVTVSISVQDSSNNTISASEVKFVLLDRFGNQIKTNNNSITISSYYEEFYWLQTSFKVGDNSYSETIPIQVISSGGY